MAVNQTVNLYGRIPPSINVVGSTSKKAQVFGLNFPIGRNRDRGGFFQKTSGIPMIRDAVKQLLLTERGERLMLPNFGCNLRKFLFQPLDENTFTQIKDEIKFSFYNYIVGAEIRKIAVFPTGDAGPAGGNSLKIILTLLLDEDQTQVFDVEATLG